MTRGDVIDRRETIRLNRKENLALVVVEKSRTRPTTKLCQILLFICLEAMTLMTMHQLEKNEKKKKSEGTYLAILLEIGTVSRKNTTD
jgi:hypothetical protein